MAQNYPHFETRCTPARVEEARISRLVDMSEGAGIPALAHYCGTIYWIPQSETTTLLLDSEGYSVREFETYSDFYGFLTSPVEPLIRAEARSNRYGVDTGTVLRIEVRTTVNITPAWKDPYRVDALANGFVRYVPVPRMVFRRDDALLEEWLTAPHPKQAELSKMLSPIAPLKLMDNETIYSSQDRDLTYVTVLEKHLRELPSEFVISHLRTLRETLEARLEDED